MNSTIVESQRLQARYSSLTDDELQAVALDANDLTDTARTVLQSEMVRRGLHYPPQPTVSVGMPNETTEKGANKFDPSDLDLTIIRRVWDRDEARNIMKILHDASIPCYLGPDNFEEVDMFHSSFDGGMDIRTRYEDEQRAQFALLRALPAESESAAEYVARCPKCHSTEIIFQGLDDNPSAESSPKENFHWSCDSCGYQWKDSGIEDGN